MKCSCMVGRTTDIANVVVTYVGYRIWQWFRHFMTLNWNVYFNVSAWKKSRGIQYNVTATTTLTSRIIRIIPLLKLLHYWSLMYAATQPHARVCRLSRDILRSSSQPDTGGTTVHTNATLLYRHCLLAPHVWNGTITHATILIHCTDSVLALGRRTMILINS